MAIIKNTFTSSDIAHVVLYKLKKLYKVFIESKSNNKDVARRKFILNILLTSALGLTFVAVISALITDVVDSNTGSAFVGESSIIPSCIFFVLLLNYYFSHKGKYRYAAYFLLTLFFLGATYTSYTWGIDIPSALLTYVLVIIMGGILISSSFALFATILISLTLLVLLFAYENHIITFNTSWTQLPATIADVTVYTVILFIIALISWLYNREMEKALRRARSSELALKKQRDQLEVMVAERTQELKKVQVEKLMQLYRFAEFGRLSSGLFHELVAPLNVISLNLEQARRNSEHIQIQEKLYSSLNRAQIGTERIESYLRAARKQIQTQDISQEFSLNDEIKQVIQMLTYKASHEDIKIIYESQSEVKLFGNPLKFNQLVTNIISNGIDSYDKIDHENNKIKITMNKSKGSVIISIQDWGSGIPASIIPKIYDPLFTTKSFEKGTGIGLALCKDIVEKEFKGSIEVISKEGAGTTFTLIFNPSLKLKKKTKNKSKKK